MILTEKDLHLFNSMQALQQQQQTSSMLPIPSPAMTVDSDIHESNVGRDSDLKIGMQP